MAETEEDDSPVSELTARLGHTLGPIIDGWWERIGQDLGRAASLETFRRHLNDLNAWTRSPRAATPDVADAVDALGLALTAADLAGRHDVVESPVELAASLEHAQLPFQEQIDFFRGKLNLPTQAWTDIWHDQHDRAFVVAGAAHANLVEDLRQAVDSAIADGTTLQKFRRDFDSIVAKHGWSYKGGRNWRTQVIYGTNVRTSYAAGRYRQMKKISDRRPYWRYRHSHASEDPREQHLAWDGMILMHDDPWWDTHYPPNGWGCKCYIEALNRRDLERLGKSGPDTAPSIRTRTVTVGANGPSPRTVEVPVGVDPGWAYAPGQSAYRAAEFDPWAIAEMSRTDVTTRQVSGQAGNNSGGLFAGSDGIRRYVKFYDDPVQSYGEAVANRAYRELGIDAPESVLVRDGDAVVGVANEIIDHTGTLGAVRRLPKGRSKEVLKGFTADVWLANWDAVGLGLDNIVATRASRNSIARIDQGGALLMRARQGRKPPERLDRISEWDGFADSGPNPAYARVFRAAGVESADELGQGALRQLDAVRALGQRTDGFRQLAPDVAGISAADRDAIRTLLARRAALLESEIRPRVLAAMREARNTPAYQARTKTAMGAWYAETLAGGERKIRAGAPRRNLTDAELATTYAYTTERQVWSHYARLNRELREAFDMGRAPQRRIDDYARTLNDALDRLPDEQGTFYRGIQLTAVEQATYTPGSVHTWAGFSSSSARRSGAFSGNTRFIILARNGKDIRRYSAAESQDEVLFKAGSRFRVIGTPSRQGGLLVIEVEEVDQ